MKNDNQLRDEAGYKGFEFDYNRNVIFDHGTVIRLAPHEADILKTLLDNRGRPTPMSALIAKVYGIRAGTARQREQLVPRREIWHRSALPWLPRFESVETVEKA